MGEAMQAGPRAVALLRQAGIATIYLIALVLARHVSINHWILLTGFHLAVLMLVPYRFWPALFVGDLARQAYISATCLDAPWQRCRSYRAPPVLTLGLLVNIATAVGNTLAIGKLALYGPI
ncbi:hypothetical protein GCM10007901_09440 [Dyella acidisoli]|uniref:Uncharacterized protein n=2 Tax=Dyella acidisoli TaxID=1867834 RepID=A0ABQ5XNC2_9GAMM|nr:hypothetical protein GCM10007901_09440 [Dyella acidisoli]